MHRRINVSFSEETLDLIDRVTKQKNRSRFIENAVRYYIRSVGRANLRKQTKEGTILQAERDIELAEEWFNLEEETWQKNQE